MGGTIAARQIVLQALEAGKHVVTANKALLSEHWPELLNAARRSDTSLHFEASVMAGVPTVRALNEGLAGNTVQSILGILNGTTNYILTRMSDEGMTYAAALKEAQGAGLAEADPALDVEGVDAAHKLSILGSIALRRWLPPKNIHREGIGALENQDIRYGQEQFGYCLKLLAIFKQHRDRVEARVHPAFIPASHPLAAVKHEYNAVYITGDPVGSIMLYGAGAGQMPAASAVVSDLVGLARAISAGVQAASLNPVEIEPKPIKPAPISDSESKFYLRVNVVDHPGVLSRIAGALGKHGVSISSLYQHGRSPSGSVPVILITHTAKEGAVRAAVADVARMRSIVKARTVVIHIEEEEDV